MNDSSLPQENISAFIDNLLKTKDPATVGLRKIIRRKQDDLRDFPIKAPTPEEFEVPGTTSRLLNENERRILELEKRVADLGLEMRQNREKAAQAVRDALSQGKAEGFKEGFDKGKTETTIEYEKKIDQIQMRVASFLKSIEDSKREIHSKSEHILMRFCLEMVKKILSSEVTMRQDIILSVVKKALSYIGDREKLRIRVAPGDFETVSGRNDFWAPVAERISDILIEQDDRIEQGGCIIESNSGIVDARLGVQFNELSELVEKVWESVNSSSSASAS